VLESSLPSERTLAEVLGRHAGDLPDRTAFGWLRDDAEQGPQLTFGELDRRARGIAAALRNVAGPGERAVLLYAPGLDFIPAFFGCLYAGNRFLKKKGNQATALYAGTAGPFRGRCNPGHRK
jgi:acyl-CoA synthetase (AMP-forming)/AMP-acid ligase II